MGSTVFGGAFQSIEWNSGLATPRYFSGKWGASFYRIFLSSMDAYLSFPLNYHGRFFSENGCFAVISLVVISLWGKTGSHRFSLLRGSVSGLSLSSRLGLQPLASRLGLRPLVCLWQLETGESFFAFFLSGIDCVDVIDDSESGIWSIRLILREKRFSLCIGFERGY
jgi:hypothetical protein